MKVSAIHLAHNSELTKTERTASRWSLKRLSIYKMAAQGCPPSVKHSRKNLAQ